MGVQLGRISEQESALVAAAQNRHKEAESARAEASKCCSDSAAGVQIVDKDAIRRATARLQQAERSLEEIEQQRRQLTSERAQAELASSQAKVSVSRAQEALGQARSALNGFEGAVRWSNGILYQIQSGQERFANLLSDTLLQAFRTDRGVVISIPVAPRRTDPVATAQLPPDLTPRLSALGARLHELLPDALIEVEAYSETGDQVAAGLLAEEIKSVFGSKFRPENVLARGFGRVPVFEGTRLTHVVPSGVQIVISSAVLGYTRP
jgi:hypothetical protein